MKGTERLSSDEEVEDALKKVISNQGDDMSLQEEGILELYQIRLSIVQASISLCKSFET